MSDIAGLLILLLFAAIVVAAPVLFVGFIIWCLIAPQATSGRGFEVLPRKSAREEDSSQPANQRAGP